MGLRFKFNLVLAVIFGLGLAVSGALSRRILEANAREEVVRSADLMMGAAMAVRTYTNRQITPHLELQLMRTFLPQSLPAFAATETFKALREQHPEYSYKEAVLNPTNPGNKALDWEADIISEFRNEPQRKDFRGSRETPVGKALYLARPIRITEGCLHCHSTPEAAPASMVKLYGSTNGFGWKDGETVGAQIVSVPMTVALERADQAFRTFMTSLVLVFLFAFAVLNVALSRLIIRPIVRMARAADGVSTGSFDIPEFSVAGRDEIAVLATSFNRMRRSLEKAMNLLE
jgi:protein-histidine pros-kinase